MQIGEKNFLSGKEETRRNPDGFQAFLTQPDEKFSVKIRAGAYWYSFSASLRSFIHPGLFSPFTQGGVDGKMEDAKPFLTKL